MRRLSRRPSVVGLLQAAATVTVAFSLATFADALHRYLELFSHFRLQYLVAALLLAIIFIALRSRAWAGVMLVTTAVNIVPVAMWYLAPTAQADNPWAEIKLLQANVWSGNTDPAKLTELIAAERPDVVVLQEITDAWVVAMNELRASYPYRHAVPRNDNFGIAIYAREPLLDVEVVDSPPFGYPSLVARQSYGDRTVTFASTHPIPPLGKSGFDARNEQLASMAGIVASVSGPTIVVGDLNTTMWAHHYDLFEETTGLVNARYGFGIVPTWPTHLPFAMIPIDHCLVSRDFAVMDMRSGPNIGSDHLPLLVTLTLL